MLRKTINIISVLWDLFIMTLIAVTLIMLCRWLTGNDYAQSNVQFAFMLRAFWRLADIQPSFGQDYL